VKKKERFETQGEAAPWAAEEASKSPLTSCITWVKGPGGKIGPMGGIRTSKISW